MDKFKKNCLCYSHWSLICAGTAASIDPVDFGQTWPCLARFAQGSVLVLVLGSVGCGGHSSVLGASLGNPNFWHAKAGCDQKLVASWLQKHGQTSVFACLVKGGGALTNVSLTILSRVAGYPRSRNGFSLPLMADVQ